jgi:hypothetical protein
VAAVVAVAVVNIVLDYPITITPEQLEPRKVVADKAKAAVMALVVAVVAVAKMVELAGL